MTEDYLNAAAHDLRGFAGVMVIGASGIAALPELPEDTKEDLDCVRLGGQALQWMLGVGAGQRKAADPGTWRCDSCAVRVRRWGEVRRLHPQSDRRVAVGEPRVHGLVTKRSGTVHGFTAGRLPKTGR